MGGGAFSHFHSAVSPPPLPQDYQDVYETNFIIKINSFPPLLCLHIYRSKGDFSHSFYSPYRNWHFSFMCNTHRNQLRESGYQMRLVLFLFLFTPFVRQTDSSRAYRLRHPGVATLSSLPDKQTKGLWGKSEAFISLNVLAWWKGTTFAVPFCVCKKSEAYLRHRKEWSSPLGHPVQNFLTPGSRKVECQRS